MTYCKHVRSPIPGTSWSAACPTLRSWTTPPLQIPRPGRRSESTRPECSTPCPRLDYGGSSANRRGASLDQSRMRQHKSYRCPHQGYSGALFSWRTCKYNCAWYFQSDMKNRDIFVYDSRIQRRSMLFSDWRTMTKSPDVHYITQEFPIMLCWMLNQHILSVLNTVQSCPNIQTRTFWTDYSKNIGSLDIIGVLFRQDEASCQRDSIDMNSSWVLFKFSSSFQFTI